MISNAEHLVIQTLLCVTANYSSTSKIVSCLVSMQEDVGRWGYLNDRVQYASFIELLYKSYPLMPGCISNAPCLGMVVEHYSIIISQFMFNGWYGTLNNFKTWHQTWNNFHTYSRRTRNKLTLSKRFIYKFLRIPCGLPVPEIFMQRAPCGHPLLNGQFCCTLIHLCPAPQFKSW